MRNYIFASGMMTVGMIFARTAIAATDYEQNIEKTFQVTPGGKLSVQADRGSIEVKTDAADQVQVRVFRKVRGGSKANADELFNNHEVTLTQDGNKVLVVAKNKTEKHFSWSINRPGMDVHYEISIPKKFEVELRTAGGDIQLGELEGNAIVRTSSGSIELSRISGKVDAADAGGNIRVAEAGESVAAKTSSGSIEVEKAGGKVEVSDAGGNIRVGEAGAEVTASTSSGSIRVGGAKGTVTLRNAGGNVEVGEAQGDVSAETSSGSIKINSAKGKVSARDAGGDITLGDIGGDISAQTSSGSVRVKAARSKAEIRNMGGNVSVDEASGNATLSTTSGNIRVGTAKGRLDAKDAGGSVQVAGAEDAVQIHTSSGQIAVTFATVPKVESRLEVSGGSIRVGLPPASGVDLDARAAGGKVVSDIPVTVIARGDQRNGLQGKINGGGPTLVLRASSGDIRLVETAGVQAEAEK